MEVTIITDLKNNLTPKHRIKPQESYRETDPTKPLSRAHLQQL